MLDATASVLGMFSAWESSLGEVQIEPEDTIVMYTDGITEAANKDGEEFGKARILDTLRENSRLAPRHLLQKIEEGVKAYRSGEQHDDLTMIIARSR